MAGPWLTNQFAKYNPKVVVYELRFREEKKGGKWKYVESELNRLTAQQYVYSTGDDTARWFGARRTGKYFPFGYYPGKFSAISPDGKERTVSKYYSEDDFDAVMKYYLKPDTKIGSSVKRRK